MPSLSYRKNIFILDINECEDGECEGLELCENNVGGFICGCPDGFTEYWGQCVGKRTSNMNKVVTAGENMVTIAANSSGSHVTRHHNKGRHCKVSMV